MKLSKEALAARAAYQKKWRAANPDKVKLYDARRWEKAAQKAAAAAQIEKDDKEEAEDT